MVNLSLTFEDVDTLVDILLMYENEFGDCDCDYCVLAKGRLPHLKALFQEAKENFSA
jgi:hypothetical protein